MNIYERAIKHWGKDKQIDKTIEELAELIKALLKDRINPSDKSKDNIIDEIADVEIMVEQLKYIFKNHTDVICRKESKLIRTGGLLK